MPCVHTSTEDWQAAADLLGEAALAESLAEMTDASVLKLHGLLRGEFTTFDYYDEHRRMIGYRHHPRQDLTALVEPYLSFFHEHPVASRWEDYIGQGMIMHLSEQMPLRRFLSTGLWNEVYIHQRVKYQLGFAGRVNPQLSWSLATGRLLSDFGPREKELSRFLQPRMTRVINTLLRRERAARVAGALHTFFSGREPAYALATADARLLELSEPARRALARNVPGGLPAPEQLPSACAELRAALAQNRRAARGAPVRRFTTVRAGALQALVLRLDDDGTSLVIFQEPSKNGATSSAPGLTRRESEIFAWIGEGKTNVDIAALLGISPRTVEKHCENLFAKLGVESRLGAALLGRATNAT